MKYLILKLIVFGFILVGFYTNNEAKKFNEKSIIVKYEISGSDDLRIAVRRVVDGNVDCTYCGPGSCVVLDCS